MAADVSLVGPEHFLAVEEEAGAAVLDREGIAELPVAYSELPFETVTLHRWISLQQLELATGKRGIMSSDDFKLPGSSYDVIAKIITAYGEFDRPASTTEVANLVDMHPTQISRNNGFLVTAGVIGSGQRKPPTADGRELGRALHWQRTADIQRLWRSLLKGNEFVEKVLTAVKVRKGMERGNLESHIAYTAGQNKTSTVMTGAAALVDILLTAGFLEDRDGKLVVSGQLPDGSIEGEDGSDRETEREKRELNELGGRVGDQQEWRERKRVRRDISVGPDIVIQLQVSCSPEDLDDLAPRIRSLLRELRQEEPDISPGDSE